MRTVKIASSVLVIVLVLLFNSYVAAAEWSQGMPVGPSVKSLGQAAAVYRGGAYLFVSTGTKILWQRTIKAPWPSQNWKHLNFATDSAPTAVQHRHLLYLFVRDPANGGNIAYTTFDGNDWSQWVRTPWHSPSSPAVANEGKKLHLFWRNESNVLVMASLSGSHWSDSTPVGGTSSVSGGLTTHVAPAAHYFNGDVNVFIVASTGQILYKRLSKPNWLFVDKVRLMDQSPIAVTVSHGKLFIFAQQGGVTYYKLRERERADRVTLLPVDQWLPVENGRARTSVAAVSFNDSVYLFYGANHASAFLPGLAAQLSPYVFMQSATWSTARIAILPLAKSDCSNGASTADFPGLIEFADSVYSPHMIRVILGHIHPHECNDLIWDLANQFIKPGDDKSGRNDKFFTTLDNIADREIFDNQILIFVTNESGGGGFSGYSIEYVYHPDQVINVCNAVGVGSTSPYRNGFAHEIGHFAGLPHTFAGVVPDGGNNRIAYTHAEVQTAFDKANYDLSIFDGDLVSFIPGFGVNDTPPDPLYEQNGVSDMKCSSVETPISLLDGRTVPPVQVDLVPPRLNLMSYYQVSPKLVHRLSRDQVKVVYQGLRSKGVIE